MRTIAALLLTISVAGCGSETPGDKVIAGRWYTSEQVAKGSDLFRLHCAVCHGDSAAATKDWRTTDESGAYPPPPLDGSAHAWHHPMAVLQQTIEVGGVPVGGVMPDFGRKLATDEIRATIAYFQSFWPDEIYEQWHDINSR